MVKKVISRVFLGLVLVLLYLPILWLIVFSFTDTTSISQWNGFSFQAYIDLFTGDYAADIFTALMNTLLIAFIAASVATILGTLAAIGLHSMRRKRLKSLYSNVSQIPMANAEIVTAISLMLLFTMFKTFMKLPEQVEFVNVILAHITFCTPYVVLNVMPRLKRMDNSVYEAALDLGAKPMQAIRKVVLPDIMPGIVMGFLLSITLSIDDFVITKFTINGFDTLSTFIYTMANGKKPLPIEIRALSAIIFLVILGLLLLVNLKNMKMNTKSKGALK